ncbi:MAG: imidazolonepropionase [Bdellovibrionales bacterium]|nr:imidazolonepropionase [Bdellovibrionales bacterium]
MLNACVVVGASDEILWVGPEKDLRNAPVEKTSLKRARRIPLKARTVFPGFVESHTHLIFSGSRAQEFEERLQGVSYLDIGKRGGGIRSTVSATRAATTAHLATLAQMRADRFLRQGVTTLEGKSGYGLSLKEEVRALKILKSVKGPRMVPTFLGLHALAPEYATYEEYFCYVMEQVLPAVKKQKLARRVDIFVDEGYFTLDQARRLFEEAKRLGLDGVAHAEQIKRTGIAALAAELGLRSVDHVLQVNDQDIVKLAKSATTAVLLPAADLYLGLPYPKARQMIDKGVRVALATDFNPGSSPTMDLALVGWLARKEMKMSLAEVFAAYTVGGAFALGMEDQVGHLSVGAKADFISTQHELQDFFYQVGEVPQIRTWISGSEIFL